MPSFFTPAYEKRLKKICSETEFLTRYDRFRRVVESVADMLDRTIDLLFRFLHQNGGHLSKRAREREFLKLTDVEIKALEEAYAEIFEA